MHHIIHLSLQPTPTQTIVLQQTVETVNVARNEISALAWHTGTFTLQALAEMCAEEIGTKEGLSLTMTYHCVASVTAAYRTQPHAQRCFRPLQSIRYDRHTLRIDEKEQSVTLWTLLGWLRISFVTDAASLNGWSLPSLMRLRGAWAILLVVPDREGQRLREGVG